MSPVATGGPPHTRAISMNGGGPVGAANDKPSGMDPSRGANRVYPHLDDLVNVRPYCDINWTLKRIIEEGELFARQADTSLDFRRFDTALKEYVKATIIAAEVIPLHRDYPNLQVQNAELHRRYIGLTKRINKQGPAITEVKDIIKENNARSRIQPGANGANGVSVGTGPSMVSREKDNGLAHSVPSQVATVNGPSARKKAPPPVQPKPEALHGKAINGDSNATPQVDLAARFARLRTPDPSRPVQDPRIRTRPIIVPESAKNETPATPLRNNVSIARPTGPREMPSVPATIPHPTQISLDVKFPVMPRLPDAVYSPDRGTESAAIPNLKTSTSSFPTNGRNNSAPPISTVGPTPLLLGQKDDYFSPPPTIDGSGSPTGPNKRKSLSLPESTIMTAEELVNLQASVRILFVDLRSRTEFDNGHIMSRSIICVEPIILRPGISGDQLSDSMVLAPDFEQDLYTKRQEFDLVVVYDQDSTSAKSSTTKIQDFMLAVYDYGYEKRVKQHPVLLIGGLDAWIDLLGPSSLQSTNTGSSSISKNGPGKSARPLNRSVVQRDSRYAERNRQRAHSLRQLPREEQLKWDATLRESAAHEDLTVQPESTSEEIINYARTTEDFFRRYPELPSIQESMISPVPPLSSSYQKLDDELRSLTPKPPTRPAPALPRQRSSGISDRRLLVSPAHAAPSSSQNQSICNTTVVPGLTGLVNKNIMCYSLSVVQALSATVFLRDLLRNFVYPPSQPIPRRGQEPGSICPQFMMRCLGNLMGHLWCGVYHNVTPNTFLKYCSSIHQPPEPNGLFGFNGTHQQDAAEFFLWLTDVLEDESNPRRDQTNGMGDTKRVSSENDPNPKQKSDDELPAKLLTLSYPEAYDRAHRELLQTRQSPITKRMKSIVFKESKCRNCGRVRREWEADLELRVSTNAFKASKSASLPNYLQDFQYGHQLEPLVDYPCPQCKKKDTTIPIEYISHFPDYLVVTNQRFSINERRSPSGGQTTYEARKESCETPFTESWDLRACGAPGLPQNVDTVYEVYAVIQHIGASIQSGHYVTMARHLDRRDEARGWHLYNDAIVKPMRDTNRRIWEGATCVFLKKRAARF